MNREPIESQYPLTIDTNSGPCTVLRHRQLYQHIQLKLSWHDTDGTDFVWVTLADNCEEGFALCDDYYKSPEPVRLLVRSIAKSWLSHWEAKTNA